MAIDIKSVLEALQKKVDAVTPSSPMEDIGYLLKGAKRGDRNLLQKYDSAAALPDLTDSAVDTEMLAFYNQKIYAKLDSAGTTVWKTFPSGSGSASPSVPSGLIVQGDNNGYTVAGTAHPGGSVNSDPSLHQILEYSFASDGNATDVGDYTATATDGRSTAAAQTSATNGYVSGGLHHPPTTFHSDIFKFSFTSPYVGSNIGDLTVANFRCYGTSSPTDGYNTGGRGFPAPAPAPLVYLTVHNKFPFASDTNATDNGDLTAGRYNTGGGNSSDVASYFAGGFVPAQTNIIEKIPFAAGGTATDVGDLVDSRHANTGSNDPASGFTMGGFSSSPGDAESVQNVIQKFAFASDGNATDHSDLATGVHNAAGSSSQVSGYASGGISATPAGAAVNVLQKFPFANTTNGTDVGDLTSVLSAATGNQN